MTLNFNTQPYFDDFDENKNFHKILFKPGKAVQARELTQIQTILQDQIGKFGKFVLSDGSKVTGGRYFVDSNALSLKLSNQNLADLSNNIQFFTGLYIVGATSNCIGKITDIDVTNFYLTVKPIANANKSFSSGETLKIFSSKALALAFLHNQSIASDFSATLATDVTTTISGVYGQKNSLTFVLNTASIEIGDLIQMAVNPNPYDNYIVTNIFENGSISVHKPLDSDYNNVSITLTKPASRYVLEVGFDDGVYFTNNVFVKASQQTIVPNLKTQYPSCVIGYEISETVLDFVDDTSLLDPAQGSYNYTAPGADRYKIYLQLVSKPLVDGSIQDLTNSKFIELLRINNGQIVSDTTGSKLGAIEDILARQMYDHAGNFIVKDFNISFHASDFKESVSTMQAEISTGKAYIFGYEYNHRSPSFFTIDKGRDKNSVSNIETSAIYGNRIAISSPAGSFLNPKSSPRVELHSTDITKANSSSLVAYAYVRNFKQVSDTEYYLNLYNISSSDISSVKSVIKPGAADYSSLNFSANTVLTNNSLQLVDPNFNSLLFGLAYNNVSSLTDVNFSTDVFDTLTVVGNSVTIHTNSLDRIFSGGAGTLSNDVKKSTFSIVTNNTNGGYSAGDYVNLNDVSITVSQGISEYTATLTFNNGYSGSIDLKYSLDILNATPKTKTEYTGTVSQVFAKVTPTSLGIADISKFTGVFYTPYSESVNVSYIGVWNSGHTYSKFDVALVGDELFVSNIDNNINSKPDNINTNWTKLQNVTSDYICNNGQTEYMYDHGYISAKDYTKQRQVFVLFNYFDHSSTGDYINFSSYPTQYSEIPVITVNNKIYDLKNYLDFRPRRTNSSLDISFTNYNIPSTLFNGVIYNMEYYLGRIDKLILNDSKQFQWLRGVPSYTNYIPPSDLSNAMTIATIQVNPFTASASDISITYKKHKRYTMDDIGNLDKRLSNVEYYTSLNMVEKDILSRNIYDSTTGQRMNNGFVVDPFIGFGTMSIADNHKNCSLDLTNQVLRPSFDTKLYTPYVVDKNGLIEQSNIISFDFSESEITNQLVATSTVNCNPFDVISYVGNLTLSPQSDNWVDTTRLPIINIINDDTAALAQANSVPGLVYNDWNSFYSTHPYTVDTNAPKTSVTVQNASNQVVYDVSSALVQQTDITKELSNNIIPYARSIPIKFNASGLPPLTELFFYVNGRLVNGYVTPDENPLGKIQTVTILNRGSNYSPSNTTVAILGANSSSAGISFDITSGVITGAEFSSKGFGYGSGTANTILSVVSGIGSNASVLLSTIPVRSSGLYSNQYGIVSGTLTLPNDDILSFPSGELHLVICDNPNYDFINATTKAEATFYSSGKTSILQETITSIREPYIVVSGQIDKPNPTNDARIVVPDTAHYTVRNDLNGIPYSALQSGVISIPVSLSKQPNSSVTVTYSNATTDQSANTTYTISPSSLSFSTTNWSTPQTVTLTYNLGARTSVDFDNKLFSYLEFYAASSDTGYNFTGSKPANSWTKSGLVGISNTKLVADSKPLPTSRIATISCTSIPTMQGSGQTKFAATPSGALLQDYLPITFTVTSSNTSICSVNGIYPPDGSAIVNTNSITITKIEDLKQFNVSVGYNNVGNTAATLTVTSTCAAGYWNGIVGTTTLTHETLLPEISPAIVVSPSTAQRKTDESGATTDIFFHLSKQPGANVVVTAASDNTAEGIISGKRQDGVTLVASNNMVVFSPTDWNSDKAIQVKGVADAVMDGDKIYTVTLTSSSSNTSWNNLTASSSVINLDKIPQSAANGSLLLSWVGTPTLTTWTDGAQYGTTNTNGDKAIGSVRLSKQPSASVTVNVSTDSPTLGTITRGNTLTFTTSNWNVDQQVEATGGTGNINTVDSLYHVLFTPTVSSSPYFDGATYPLVNVKAATTKTEIKTTSTSTFEVVSNVDPASWVPGFTVTNISQGSYGNLSAVMWNRTDLDPSWNVRGGVDTSPDGSARTWVAVVLQGVKGVDQKPDGWCLVDVTLTLDPNTTWANPTGLPTNFFVAGNSPQYSKYSSYPTSGAQNPPYQFKVTDDKTVDKISFETMLYEADAYFNDPGWKTNNSQIGWCRTDYNFGGLFPNFSYYDIKVVETKTTINRKIVTDIVSGQIISDTIDSQSTNKNDVWVFKAKTPADQIQPLTNGSYSALVTWLQKFPSAVSNKANGDAMYKAWDAQLKSMIR